MFMHVQYFNIGTQFENKGQSLRALLVNLIQICIYLCILFFNSGFIFLTHFSLIFSPDPSLKTPPIKDRFNVHWDLFYIISLF